MVLTNYLHFAISIYPAISLCYNRFILGKEMVEVMDLENIWLPILLIMFMIYVLIGIIFLRFIKKKKQQKKERTEA